MRAFRARDPGSNPGGGTICWVGVCSILFKKILVAFDGSSYSRKALEYGCRLASVFNSVVHIVSVIDTARVQVLLYDMLINIEEDVHNELVKMLDKTLGELREKYPDIEIDYIIRKGHPVREIMDEINKWKPDLLVIGGKGRSDLREVELGSVAQALIKNVDKPVLVVK